MLRYRNDNRGLLTGFFCSAEHLVGIIVASMPALKPIFDRTFNLSKGFSKQSELQDIPMSEPVIHMQLPSGSVINGHRMEEKCRWTEETSTSPFDESSMSTRKDSDSGRGRDFSSA